MLDENLSAPWVAVTDLATSASAALGGRAMREVRHLLERVAVGTISVLIAGETGVGKEVVAAAVHHASKRAAKPFLKLNCAALSESLLESELFGHEKGSFTGAVGTKPGLLETADGGTIFLDELGEMPMTVQVKLLRVIEERAVMRVGGLKTKSIDVRFVAATNRDLEAAIAMGTFRQDLYFRLNGVTLEIPPLRERIDEIAGLASAFVAATWQKLERDGDGGGAPVLAHDALVVLESHAWPGNIRELRNAIERAVLLCSDGVITAAHLPTTRARAARGSTPIMNVHVAAMASVASIAEVPTLVPAAVAAAAPMGLAPIAPTGLAPIAAAAPTPFAEPTPPLARSAAPRTIRSEVEALERLRILEALSDCAGNQTHAARRLGMSRATLLGRLDTYGIKRPRKPRAA